MANGRSFDPRIVLDGARIVAARLDRDLIVREVSGDWFLIPIGADIRDTIPAMVGMEDALAGEVPEVDLPFVTLDAEGAAPVSLTALRYHGDVWLLIRDVSEAAATRQRLVQQHNALTIAQRELAAARDAALAADRAKTAFLANISHELRTPLNVVIGGASILMKRRDTPLPQEEVHAYATDICDAGELLLQLVNDLIDLSRAETGTLALYEEWCSIPALAEEIARLVRALPEAEGIAIVADFGGPLPEFYCDPTRVKQILLNLLSNAVKACDSGATITILLRREAGGDLLIAVRDDGPGMNAQDLAVALEPFGQPDARNRSQGAGLGLAIVSRLAELHNGRFGIETRSGEGLTASVKLPGSRFAGTGTA